MPHLALIRRRAVSDRWDYYDSKTEAWMFGDAAGYDVFKETLLTATKSEGNVHLPLLAATQISMVAVILPTQQTRLDTPRLKCIERLVWIEGKPRMELVIAGNDKGYCHLAERVSFLISSGHGDFSEHLHFDDEVDPWLLRRSVALNIRAPLPVWEKSKLGEFAEWFEKESEDSVPKELRYRLANGEEYLDVSVRDSEAVRI